MNRETLPLIGILASAFLFLWTSHPIWFLVSAACGAMYGWNFGKRYWDLEGA